MDVEIAQLADRQYGVVALWQLLELGLSPSAVRSRVATGRLHRIHRGVYVVGAGPRRSRDIWLGAVLACGSCALLSHRSSMMLLGPIPSSRATIDVTAPKRRRRHTGIKVYTSRTITKADVARVDNIPCTSAARTLLDFADHAGERELRRAVDALERLRVFDGRPVDAVLDRADGRRGAARLRAVLDIWTEPPFTRSGAEKALLEIVEEAGLPRPSMNVWVAGYEVDAYWANHGLVVEFDSWEFHRTRQAFEEDRIRDADLGDAGIRVIRISWRQLGDRDGVVGRLSRALAAAAVPGPSAASRPSRATPARRSRPAL